LSLLRDRAFIAAAAAHFGVDFLNSQKSLLLAFLSGPLALTNSAIGLINTLYVLTGSLAQPLFGMLADRFGTRWVVAGGLSWLAIFFSGAVLLPGQWALLPLVVAALGSAAFHPAGAMEATVRGRIQSASRETTAASAFFVFGQTGLSLGPAIGGPLLDRWGTVGLLVLPLLVSPTIINAAANLKPLGLEVGAAGEPASGGAEKLTRRALPFFILLAAGRSWIQFNFTTFLPKYFADLGMRPASYGFMAALFMGAGAMGNVLGGYLGDRVDRKRIVVLSLLASVIPILMFPGLGTTSGIYLVTLLAGGLIGISHSIIVVTAQHQLPGRMGAASGLILGFMFSSASLGTLLSGVLADRYGFETFFTMTAALATVSGLLGLSLPRE
jgi:FSR family fosmidomycin resistance protein-like MFS transporter